MAGFRPSAIRVSTVIDKNGLDNLSPARGVHIHFPHVTVTRPTVTTEGMKWSHGQQKGMLQC